MPDYPDMKLPEDKIYDPCYLEQGLLKRYSRLFFYTFLSGLMVSIIVFLIMWFGSKGEEDRAFLIWIIPALSVAMPLVVVPIVFLFAVFYNSFLIFGIGENELIVTDVLHRTIRKIEYGKISEIDIRTYTRHFFLWGMMGNDQNRSVTIKYPGGEIKSEWVFERAEKKSIDGFVSQLKEKLGEGKVRVLNK